MSLTMPRRYGTLPGPPGERRASCDLCGMTFYRSTMRRMPGGQLWCNEEDGNDTLTLDRANAQGATMVRYPRPATEKW